MNYRSVAQEAVSWYLSHIDEYSSHQDNVQKHLRGPVIALTASILNASSMKEHPTSNEETTDKKSTLDTSGSDWRDYLAKENSTGTSEFSHATEEAFERLSRRTQARLEAFLECVSLAVSQDAIVQPPKEDANKNNVKGPSRATSAESDISLSLVEGLAGLSSFESNKKSKPPVLSSLNASGKNILRSISSSQSSAPRFLQARQEDLVTRLELYIRCLTRVKSHEQECVVAAEPARAIKARARSLVAAFVETVGTVQQQSSMLTRLLSSMTREVLAVDVLGEQMLRLIRRLVSDYEHRTSFASLAFLSSPDDAADQLLTPMVLKYLKYLQLNWKTCVTDCELERMLSRTLEPKLRHLFKTIEFRSIGHLLEVCQEYRQELHHIELPPGIRGDQDVNLATDNAEAVRQAIRDLQREVITVNGQVLPPVTSRKDLIQLLSQMLNSRSLTAPEAMKRISRRKVKHDFHKRTSAPVASPDNILSADASESEMSSSGNEADTSRHGKSKGRQRYSFRISTIDFLTKRVLLAAGRTGTGGDAYFVVRDLFGGEDVEVVPSKNMPTHGRATRPGSIELLVKLASVTIKCHASFDVYPKSLVGECEPLIQLHTTTTEVISLKEVRATDSSGEECVPDEYSSDDSDKRAVMVLQERQTERTGWRTLAIRPALYEKVEVWNTPS